MLVSVLQLARKMTDQLISQITRASSAVGVNHNIETNNMPSEVSPNGPRDTSYEDAVHALHDLQSNAEAIAKARLNLNRKVANNIPNMIKYIIRSGLTMEDVDKLSVIHVSGTKGKGSTCALCERVLHFHGYKTGLFTSPHLIEVRERIRINGKPISQRLFSKHFWKIYNRLQVTKSENESSADDGEAMPPYFAFLTVLSLHVFLSEGVDVVVIEVGIGGQYDSTNFFRKPVVCGVTSLGIDHTALLGNTIQEIAWNKAGIFKPGRPAITIPHEQAAMDVLLDRAHEIQSPLYVSMEMSEELIHRKNVTLGIAGAKQFENASLAIQLFRMWEKARNSDRGMADCIPDAGRSTRELLQLEVLELDDATLKGLSSCVWPGRAQTVHREDITYYLDGAHTKESMQVCAQWFAQTAKQEEERDKRFARVLLFNTTSDRDAGTLLACLMECHFDAVIFCTNILSSVDSMNRVDQLNKTVTPKGMMEKVNNNKAIWDDLVSQNRQQLAVGEDINSCGRSGGCYEKTCQVNPRATTNVDHSIAMSSNSVLDHNLNNKDSVQMEIGPHYEGSSIKKRKVPHAAFVDSQIDSLGQSGSQVRRICSSTHNSSAVNGRDAVIDTFNSIPAQDTSDGGCEQCSKLSTNSTLQNHAQQDFNPEVPCLFKGAQSYKFSCILSALNWATQGRHHTVKAGDPGFSVPPIPVCLSDASHLQILVTGSLHLVGGVLGVIDPQMND